MTTTETMVEPNGCGISYPCPECDTCAYCGLLLPQGHRRATLCVNKHHAPACDRCVTNEKECAYCEAPTRERKPR
jgi:hypothetical protein